jgi:hypothetical protein
LWYLGLIVLPGDFHEFVPQRTVFRILKIHPLLKVGIGLEIGKVFSKGPSGNDSQKEEEEKEEEDAQEQRIWHYL